MRKRNWGIGKKLLVLLAAGVLYYLWARLTGLVIPCMFRKITGWLCPGCGITTLFLRLGRLDFKGAFWANPFLFCTSPFLVFEIFMELFRDKRKTKEPFWNKVLVWVYLVFLIAFGIVRNVMR